jgi:hypothetical protein
MLLLGPLQLPATRLHSVADCMSTPLDDQHAGLQTCTHQEGSSSSSSSSSSLPCEAPKKRQQKETRAHEQQYAHTFATAAPAVSHFEGPNGFLPPISVTHIAWLVAELLGGG